MTLELRNAIKKRKPAFRKTDSHKKKRLTKSWRKPRGYQNKTRLQKHGKPAIVKPGYRSPAAVRGMDKNGLRPVCISTIAELEQIDTKTQSVLLKNTGMRTQQLLLKACKEKNIPVSNVNIDEKLKSIEEKIAARKETRKEKLKSKEKKEQKKIEKKKEKKETTSEEKKKEETKEREKVLTKRT